MRLLALAGFVLVGSCSFLPGSEANMEKRAQDVLANVLNDPASAQFRELKYATAHEKGKPDEKVICGQVNAKNRFGAYIGFHRFIASTTDNFAAVDPETQITDPRTRDEIHEVASQAGFDEAWKICAPSA